MDIKAKSLLIALLFIGFYFSLPAQAQDISNTREGADIRDFFSGWSVQRGNVGGGDPADWFGLRMQSNGIIDVNLSLIESDADLEVWRNNSFVGSSTNFGTEFDRVDNINFNAGDIIHVGVIGFSTPTPYVANVILDAPAPALTLGNISAIGEVSFSVPFTACTIIDNPNATIIILAERLSSNVDPDLYFAPASVPPSQVRNSPQAFRNDDFSGTVPIINRPLGSFLDSALVLSNLTGAWCAHVFSLSGVGNVSIQINDEALF